MNGFHWADIPDIEFYVTTKISFFLFTFLSSAFVMALDSNDDFSESREDHEGLNETEKYCFEAIYWPSLQIHIKISKRLGIPLSPDNLDDDDLEAPRKKSELVDDWRGVVKQFAVELSVDEIRNVEKILKSFFAYLEAEEKFLESYTTHLTNIKDTVQIGGISAIVALLFAVPSSLAQIAQNNCQKYACLDDDFDLLSTEQVDGKPYNYCGRKGADINCLKYLHYAYGYNDLTHVSYVENCSEDLDPILLLNNTIIPLGQIVRYCDTTCVILLALLPYIPSLAFLIPGVVLGGQSVFSAAKLKIREYQINKKKGCPSDLDLELFKTAHDKVEEIAAPIGAIVHFSAHFFGLSEDAQNGMSRLFADEPIHYEVEALLENFSLIKSFKAGLRKAFCCCD